MQLEYYLKVQKRIMRQLPYDDVIKVSPTYGPVYRELAETYYYWANNVPVDTISTSSKHFLTMRNTWI
jgi:hypothetical protein